jgi:uncharacterized BrkB/YihY/UPF0761 family membrane protein
MGRAAGGAKWRWISVGSVFAALAWLMASALFSWYLGNFANYNATYGALGAVVGLMMWMWLSTIVVRIMVRITAGSQQGFHSGCSICQSFGGSGARSFHRGSRR